MNIHGDLPGPSNTSQNSNRTLKLNDKQCHNVHMSIVVWPRASNLVIGQINFKGNGPACKVILVLCFVQCFPDTFHNVKVYISL